MTGAEHIETDGWTPVGHVVPEPLQKYLDRFDRLNPLQSKAVPAVLATDGHVMVVAPTSSGKTLIGEVAALRAIVAEGRHAVWLLPARALASEVGETVRRWRAHGIRSVELTGETNMSSDAVRQAQLWVATTEKFEALYRRASLQDAIERIGCLIVDEVHLVGDPARGATLESLLARLRATERTTRIVALSATVANADELARWFHADLITSHWRPTSLTTRIVPYDPPAGGRREQHESAKDGVVIPLLRTLLGRAAGGLGDGDPGASAVVFCGSKAAVLRTAARAAGVTNRPADVEGTVEDCFARGVGVHFRGAPGAARALQAFRARELRLLVATSGLSTGVNTPAKHVIIRDLELGMTPLEVSQAQQMLGRAGRAGHEAEGFGYLLSPRSDAKGWEVKLVSGYAARSRIAGHLGDALLAEMVLGSVSDRADAGAWYEQTLAFAQSAAPARERIALGVAVDRLVRDGFVVESEGRLQPTEIGALTSRLMIDVASAGRMLRALARLPRPAGAAHAEELLIQAVASAATALRERPVNERTYSEYVTSILRPWHPRVVAGTEDFGARVCMAAAQIALREPRRAREHVPTGVVMAEFVRAVDDMPRYLAWVAALGPITDATWEPAVAGDLARRLSWWHLGPHPERGTGRLLWMLERMLEPQHRRTRMPDLWGRARRAGFGSPDGIHARPRGVDITPAAFAELVAGRAALREDAGAGSRAGRVIADGVDTFLYTREGDWSYLADGEEARLTWMADFLAAAPSADS